jgi:hypothetical protein
MLGVAALELGYPVLLLFLPEVDDPPLNRHHAMPFFSHFRVRITRPTLGVEPGPAKSTRRLTG